MACFSKYRFWLRNFNPYSLWWVVSVQSQYFHLESTNLSSYGGTVRLIINKRGPDVLDRDCQFAFIHHCTMFCILRRFFKLFKDKYSAVASYVTHLFVIATFYSSVLRLTWQYIELVLSSSKWWKLLLSSSILFLIDGWWKPDENIFCWQLTIEGKCENPFSILPWQREHAPTFNSSLSRKIIPSFFFFPLLLFLLQWLLWKEREKQSVETISRGCNIQYKMTFLLLLVQSCAAWY